MGRSLIIESFVPPEEVKMLEEGAVWSEDDGVWKSARAHGACGISDAGEGVISVAQLKTSGDKKCFVYSI